MNTLELLSSASLPNFNDADLNQYAQQVVSDTVENGGDVVRLTALSAKLELLAAYLKTAAKSAALNEVRSYGKDGVSRFGVTLNSREVGVSYDYSTDPIWQRLNEEVVRVTAIRKAHETRLRNLPHEGREIADEETGEVYRAYPPAKRGSEAVTISIQ